MPDAKPVIQNTDRGLYCTAGDFFVDPWRPVTRAIVTHAHTDHACPGCGSYLCSESGAAVLRERVGADARIETVPFGRSLQLKDARISLHPAGHLLGSAQVRVEAERAGEVWVVSGDYKTEADRTCEAFEPVKCDVFITESTFGLPVYRWRPQAEVFAEIDAWWRANQEADRTSVLMGYALGKAQRLLAGVDASIGPIVAHGAVARFVPIYRLAGVALPETLQADAETLKRIKGRGLVVAPPSALNTPWLRKFQPYSIAFASGWMILRGARRRKNVDRGFVLSDHADWTGLLATIETIGARRVGVTHGYTHAMSRYLAERGYDAFTLQTRFEGETLEVGAEGLAGDSGEEARGTGRAGTESGSLKEGGIFGREDADEAT